MSLTVNDGEDERAPNMDSKPDKIAKLVMKGVLRCIELHKFHKFHMSNGYGRAEAKRDFMLQYVALPNNLSMDVQAERI